MSLALPDDLARFDYVDPRQKPYPFCAGCSHAQVLDAIDGALRLNRADPRRTVLVSDIGCVGLADKYFNVHTFHGLHGRSFTYASGVKLARPDLGVFVLVGDGGCGIGGHHLINAARRNIGITVIVFNNYNFGMTGGQHSVTTPTGGVTATTPGGNLERGLDIAGLALAAGAPFVAKVGVFDKRLPEVIARAMRFDGFALVEVGEICTAYYMKRNDFKRKQMEEELLRQVGVGVLRDEPMPELAARIRGVAAPKPPAAFEGVHAEYEHALPKPSMSLLVAGSAGGKVLSAAGILGQAALYAGLWSVQKDDYPITIQSGHSVAALKIASSRPHHQSSDTYDAAVVLTDDGARYCREELAALPDDAVVLAQNGVHFSTPAAVRRYDFHDASLGLTRDNLAFAAVTLLALATGSVPREALLRAVKAEPRADIRDANLKAFDAGEKLAQR